MTRRMSPKRRAAIFAAHEGVCHICEGKIGVGEGWEVEHCIPLEISGDDSDGNLAPSHVKCHRTKTKADARDIAKCRRVAQKHTGARKKKGGIPYRKFNGEAVWPGRDA
jgi:5-methylcytosine-specific restriction endonuclease McrA